MNASRITTNPIGCFVLTLGGLLLALGSCKNHSKDDAEVALGDHVPIHISGLVSLDAAVGQPVDVVAAGIGAHTNLRLHIQGTFISQSGARREVDFTTPDLQRLEGDKLRWDTFGPTCPEAILGDCSEPGTLEATWSVGYVPVGSAPEIIDPAPSALTVNILPSLIVTDFQPVDTSCARPAAAAFAGLSYRTAVRAMGFAPTNFAYTLTVPDTRRDAAGVMRYVVNGSEFATKQTHVQHAAIAGHNDDKVEDSEAFALPEMPLDATDLGFMLETTATDAQGQTYTSHLVMKAGLPVEVIDTSDQCELVEILKPAAVSDCIDGGATGTSVEYNEKTNYVFSREISLTYDQAFVQNTKVEATEENTLATTNGITLERLSRNYPNTPTTQTWRSTETSESSNTFDVRYKRGTVAIRNVPNQSDPLSPASSNVFCPTVYPVVLSQSVGWEYWNVDFCTTNPAELASLVQKPAGKDTAKPKPTTDTASTLPHHVPLLRSFFGRDAVTKARTSARRTGTNREGLFQTAATAGANEISPDPGGTKYFMWQASSSQLTGVGAASVLPHSSAVWYGQALRQQCHSYLTLADKCGNTSVIATATLENWAWSAELASQPGECRPDAMPTPTLLSPDACFLPAEQCAQKHP